MRYKFEIETDNTPEDLQKVMEIYGKVYKVQKVDDVRSSQQNNAMHLWFSQYAELLNDAGFDVKATVREDIEVPWTGDLIKSVIWKPLLLQMYGKKSTRKMEKKMVNKLLDTINKTIGVRTGVPVPEFPSQESLFYKDK